MGPSSRPGMVLSSLPLRALGEPLPTSSSGLTSSLQCLWPWGAELAVRLLRETPASFPKPTSICQDSRSPLLRPQE